jgi:hypothetical protein
VGSVKVRLHRPEDRRGQKGGRALGAQAARRGRGWKPWYFFKAQARLAAALARACPQEAGQQPPDGGWLGCTANQSGLSGVRLQRETPSLGAGVHLFSVRRPPAPGCGCCSTS